MKSSPEMVQADMKSSLHHGCALDAVRLAVRCRVALVGRQRQGSEKRWREEGELMTNVWLC